MRHSTDRSPPTPRRWNTPVVPVAVFVALISFGFAMRGIASNGRHFFAEYSVTTPTRVDTAHTSVTLTLNLHNMSGGELVDASILLMDPIIWTKQIAEVAANINVRHRASATVAGTVTVDTSEYQRWRAGGAPTLFVHYTSAAGVIVNRPIELMPMPGTGANP